MHMSRVLNSGLVTLMRKGRSFQNAKLGIMSNPLASFAWYM